MASWVYTNARIDARFHLQVEFTSSVINKTPAEVPLKAVVVKIFRGEDQLKVGDEVHFSVDVTSEKDEPMFGDEIWQLRERFEVAKYLEVFLDGRPPDCNVAEWQCIIIDTPSDKPKISVPKERGGCDYDGSGISIDEFLENLDK